MTNEMHLNRDGISCTQENIRIPRLELAQWTNCWQCIHRGEYVPSERAYRCGIDGVVESSGGCSGAGSESYDQDEPDDDEDD